MKRILLFFVIVFIYAAGLSQPSDFILLRKGRQTVKSFFTGSNISFETNRGFYSGQINGIHRDSLFLTEFDIRQVPTRLGVTVSDTIATYRSGFNYKDIIKIENQKRKGFNLAATGASLLGGGVLLTVAGLGTWIFTRPGTQYHASTAFVISSAALAGIGYFLLKSKSSGYSIGKKYRLEYVKVK